MKRGKASGTVDGTNERTLPFALIGSRAKRYTAVAAWSDTPAINAATAHRSADTRSVLETGAVAGSLELTAVDKQSCTEFQVSTSSLAMRCLLLSYTTFQMSCNAVLVTFIPDQTPAPSGLLHTRRLALFVPPSIGK